MGARVGSQKPAEALALRGPVPQARRGTVTRRPPAEGRLLPAWVPGTARLSSEPGLGLVLRLLLLARLSSLPSTSYLARCQPTSTAVSPRGHPQSRVPGADTRQTCPAQCRDSFGRPGRSGFAPHPSPLAPERCRRPQAWPAAAGPGRTAPAGSRGSRPAAARRPPGGSAAAGASARFAAPSAPAGLGVAGSAGPPRPVLHLPSRGPAAGVLAGRPTAGAAGLSPRSAEGDSPAAGSREGLEGPPAVPLTRGPPPTTRPGCSPALRSPPATRWAPAHRPRSLRPQPP